MFFFFFFKQKIKTKNQQQQQQQQQQTIIPQLAKAENSRKGTNKKSGKERKKEWSFKERKGVSFKSKKKYKRHK